MTADARKAVPRLAFFLDFEPEASDFRHNVLEGLRRTQKAIPPKYFYDERGSQLFDDITSTPEYYVTCTELALLETVAPHIADETGPAATVVEFGSGSSLKIRLLLDALETPKRYAALDISREHLLASCEALAADYSALEVGAICADFTKKFDLPENALGQSWRIGFFPGSTLGNFEPTAAVGLLKVMRGLLRDNDSLLLGVDLKKDPAVLEAAYNDASGVTAAFNKNLLTRINRELDGDIDENAFDHRAIYVENKGAIEMRLIAKRDVSFTVSGERFEMARGEHIHTENSYKFLPSQLHDLVKQAGFEPYRRWTDEREYFALELLRAR